MPVLALKKKELKQQPEKSEKSATSEPSARLSVPDIKSLADKLIQQARHLPASGEMCGDGEQEDDEVLLDLEADGVRCLILRTHPKPAVVSVSLSPREQEIARMIARGYPNKTIAAVLEISPWTVCTHIRRVFAKFGVGSRAEMVAKMLENNSRPGSATNGHYSHGT